MSENKVSKKYQEVPASHQNRVKFLFCLQKEIHSLWLWIVKMKKNKLTTFNSRSWESHGIVADGKHPSSGPSQDIVFEVCGLCEHQSAMMSSANLRPPPQCSGSWFSPPGPLVLVLAVLHQYWCPPHLFSSPFAKIHHLPHWGLLMDQTVPHGWGHGQFWDTLKLGCPALGNLLLHTLLDRLCHREGE